MIAGVSRKLIAAETGKVRTSLQISLLLPCYGPKIAPEPEAESQRAFRRDLENVPGRVFPTVRRFHLNSPRGFQKSPLPGFLGQRMQTASFDSLCGLWRGEKS
jgi:hypothetical protein